MKKIFLMIMILTIATTSCSYKKGRFYPFWAKAASLKMMEPPPGPPEYQQGYMDGCESGFKGYSKPYNQIWWRFRQDPVLRQNDTYLKVWRDSYFYCAAYALSIAQHGISNFNKSGVFQ